MVNSHYVPQLILRHFAEAEKIQYCDLRAQKVETRNIKTTFAEKGYYPDSLEQELCHRTEVQFANLLNNKILHARNKIIFTREELFILKKYLVVTTIRYNLTEKLIEENKNSDGWIRSYSEDFFNNINKVLACEKIEDMFDYINIKDPIETLNTAYTTDKYAEVKLFSDIKRVLHSYIVIAETRQCNKNFVISDTGYGYEATHTDLAGSGEHFDKCTYVLNYATVTGNPYLLQMSCRLDPYDYSIFPISKDKAIISFSSFYKFFNSKSDVYGLLPIKGMTVYSLLGFGSSDIVEPPKVNMRGGDAISYEYQIKQLYSDDVHYLNSVLINSAKRYIGYYSLDRVKTSISYYNSLDDIDRRYLLDYLLQ